MDMIAYSTGPMIKIEAGIGRRSAVLSLIVMLLLLSFNLPHRDMDHPGGYSILDEQEKIKIETTRGSLGLEYIEGLQYIAIGPDRFRDELQPLIDWKTQKGVRARFYPLDTEDGILENYQDRDVQAEIRSFIGDMVEINSIKWVLLAGDGEIIPTRKTFTNENAENGGDDEKNYVHSDFYYAGTDGSWDRNGNEVYGEYMEQDWEANVYVGRFPASSENDMQIMVRKQLSYEKNPPRGSWSESMLLAGSLMDTPNDPYYFQSYKDNAYELVRNIESDLPDHVTPFHLVDYPKLEYGGYNQMFDTLNRSSFKAFYEMGHSTVLLACHGDPFNGNCTNYKGDGGGRLDYIRDYEDHFTYEMAGTIENGERLPLVYISSCGSTPFMESDDTNMERLLGNPNGGAIGLIGATVETYRGEFRPDPENPEENSSYGNWWLAQEFFRLLYEGHTRPGEALYMQKWNYITHVENEYSYDPEYFKMFHVDNLAYNLLGDPEGPIWVDTPQIMVAEYPDPYVYDNGTMEIRVFGEDGVTPLQNSLVTITCRRDPGTYLTGRTDALGTVQIDIIKEDLEPLTITITKDGYIPWTKIIKVYSNMNIGISSVQLIPDVPTGNEELSLLVGISNTGNRDIGAFKIFVNLTNTPGLEDEFAVLGFKNNTRIMKPLNLSRNRPEFGINHLSIRIEIFPIDLHREIVVIESEFDDNTWELDFRANHPIEVADYFPPLKIKEDSSLREDSGFFNLTRSHIFDFDNYPEEIRVWAEVIFGEIDVVISGTLVDVIPEPDWNGEGRIQIFASDGSSSGTGFINVEVTPQPDPPQFVEYPKSFKAKENEELTFYVIIKDIDSEEMNLTSDKDWVHIERYANSSAFIFNITTIPADEDVGDVILRLVAIDETNRTEEIRINIDVEPTNDPPEISLNQNLTFEQGSKNDILMSIEDPDGSSDFLMNISWNFGTVKTTYSNFTLEIPDDAPPGTYDLIITVDDGSGGITTLVKKIIIKEKRSQTSFLYIAVIIIIIITILLIYGIAIRMQENKQRRLLDSVGTNATLEAKALSEKDFRGGSRRRRMHDDGIPMPPVPGNVEGALIREEKREEKKSPSYRSSSRDIDLDIDDVISEMFPK
ncbi:MAG: C25 family cysteine peptidase [Candidatus Thermoplasmatota archaeon]|nr:C25 family cysteine peptidase [Candidatus Thermoplasmatota archaeon]